MCRPARPKLRRVLPALALGVVAGAGGCFTDPPDDEARPGPSAPHGNVADGPAGVAAAVVETDPPEGDADDPAVWVHPDDPALSLVIGTDKDQGVGVYDLSGRLLQFLRDGTPNNVDVRDGFPLAGSPTSIVVTADDDGDGALWVYRVDPAARRLVNIAAGPIPTGIEAHGVCLYRSPTTGKLYAFPNDQDGRTEQWELFDDGTGRIDGRQVRAWDTGDAVEGCVADDAHGLLYVGEEEGGVWRYGAEPGEATDSPVLVDRTGAGGHLVADVEGLTLVDTGGGDGYLVASSQGDDSFAVYRRRPGHDFVGRFEVGGAAASTVDGCEDTDGIEIVNRPLGPAFPNGLFVCQDGENGEEESNFKLVPLDLILRSLPA